MKKICIIIDNPQRDLAGYVYLAEELAKNNLLIFLIPMYNFHEIFFINPDLVILNHARKDKLHSSGIDLIIEYCRLTRIKIVVIESEGGLISESFVKRYKKILNESNDKIDRYFLWGSNKIPLVNKFFLYKYIVTGHPRFDIFFLKNYKNKFLKNFKKKNYILINTSFVRINPIEGNRIGLIESKKYKAGKLYKHEKSYFDKLLRFLKSFSEKNSNISFVIRPHPFESVEIYKREFANCNNVAVNNEGDIYFYLKYCKFVVNYNCQTSLDAVLAGKNSINFSSFRSTKKLKILDKISTRVENEIQLLTAINKFLISNKVVNLENRKELVAEYYNNIKEISSKIIIHNILLLLKNLSEKNLGSSIFRIIIIYIKKRSFLEVIKFIIKLFLGTQFIFTIRIFFGNQMYKRKYFDLNNVLELVRFINMNKLIIKKCSLLDFNYKFLLFPQSIIIRKK